MRELNQLLLDFNIKKNFNDHDYYQTLRNKMNWKGDLRYK